MLSYWCEMSCVRKNVSPSHELSASTYVILVGWAHLIIYVCHSFSTDPDTNAHLIRRQCRQIAESRLVPLAPQLFLPQFLDEDTERELALGICFELIGLADEVWVYGEATDGMRLEIAEAERLGIPVVRKEAT